MFPARFQTKGFFNKVNGPVERGGFPFDCLATTSWGKGGKTGEEVRKGSLCFIRPGRVVNLDLNFSTVLSFPVVIVSAAAREKYFPGILYYYLPVCLVM